MADVKDDIGFDAAGRVVAIGPESRAEETRILEHPDAQPVLIAARLHGDLALRTFGPPSLELADLLDRLARDYRRAVVAALAARQ